MASLLLWRVTTDNDKLKHSDTGNKGALLFFLYFHIFLNSFLRQLERLHLENPARQVIFITFESAVKVYGDCTENTFHTVPESKHDDFTNLLADGEHYSVEHQVKPLNESYE